MDANQLLFYLRGFFELVPDPTPDQVRSIRTEVLRAEIVKSQLVPIEVQNPISGAPKSGNCGCKGN